MAMNPENSYLTKVIISVENEFRVIKSNGIPDHEIGQFPNPGNPNTMREQSYTFSCPVTPSPNDEITPLGMFPFGVAVNGVPFDPFAAEWWNGDWRSGWQYEAMSLGPKLGLDENNAHVQPNGAYHYHGIPSGLIDKLSRGGRPILIGYAADGFPIYAPWGYEVCEDRDSGMKELRSSYKVKSGSRPSGGPEGNHDGMFVQDYEFDKGTGDLDECNGRWGVTRHGRTGGGATQ